MKKSNLGLFAGKDAIKDYLNPDNNPPLPLVELPPSLNPLASDGVHIFAKLMNTLPLANIKSLPALNMILDAEKKASFKVRTPSLKILPATQHFP